MKKFVLITLLVALLSGSIFGAFTKSIDDTPTYKNAYRWTGKPKDYLLDWAQEVEDRLTGATGLEYSSYTATDTEPGTTAGMFYYDLSENKFKYYNGGGWIAIEAGASGNSLDGAYDVGSAITVDAATVGLTATNAGDVIALTVTQQDTGATVAQSIVSAGTGALLSFDSNGTGADILGSDSTWNVSKAGLATFAGGLTLNTGGELLVSARDILFDDTYDVAWDTSRDQLIFQDNAVLGLGGAHDAAADITLMYDGTDLLMEAAAADDVWKIGATTNFDINVYGDTATDTVIFDTSAEDVQFNGFDLTIQDADLINFGDSDDVTVSFDGTNFELFALAEDTPFAIGGTVAGFDTTYYFETAGQFRTDYDADFINLTDDMDLRFGTGASSNGDFQISSSSANLLTIGQIVAGTGSVAFGVNDAGLDVKLFGDTAGAYWLWDTSEDTMTVVGGNATITTDDAEANQFKVNATGAVAGIAVQLETTDGGIHLLADGETGGDITLDAEDDIILTTTGKLTITNTEPVTVSGTLTPVAVNIVDAPITDTASVTLTAATSGKIHPIGDLTQNTTIDLPVEANGLNYEFWYTGGAAEVHDHVIDAEANANFYIGGVQFVDSDDNSITGVYSNGSSNAKITLSNLEAGSYIKITCDGTNWYITGIIYSDTAPAFADAV